MPMRHSGLLGRLWGLHAAHSAKKPGFLKVSRSPAKGRQNRAMASNLIKSDGLQPKSENQ